MKRTTLFSASLALVLAACGGDDGDDGGVSFADSGPTGGDSGGGGAGGDGDGACRFNLPAEFAPLTLALMDVAEPDEAGNPSPGSDYLILSGAPLDEAQEDWLNIQLWTGYGAFADGEVTAGTYELTGAEADLIDCGACVYIGADPNAQDEYTQIVMASGGTLTIEEVDPQIGGVLRATASGVTVREISIEGAEGAEQQVEVTGGCEATLPSFTIDATIQQFQ